MLKKLTIAALIFTLGETVAYANVNREARKLAKRDNKPVLVITATKWHHYPWVEMSTDPTIQHSDDPRTTH